MAGIYSVSQINSYIRNMFAQDYLLTTVAVKGEVSNCKYHASGHIYFTLKDAKGSITCVMFAGNRQGLPFRLSDGSLVVVTGSVDVYEREGKYQLYAKKITADGLGLLYEEYIARREKLAEMGMFAPEYKQPLPRYISKLGIVTSPTGAALQDIINVAKRRNPYLEIIVYPAIVQGDAAAATIVSGIEALARIGVDVMIVGRGGGSIEDLWAFNEEAVARAVFDCPVPVIAAVGHETDTTIIDFVADMRAPTPSAAAELAVYDFAALTRELAADADRLRRILDNRLEIIKYRMLSYQNRLRLVSPLVLLREKRTDAMGTEERLLALMETRIKDARHQLSLYGERLHGLSPLRKLTGGYAFIRDGTGTAVRGIAQIERGERLEIRLADGHIIADVIETHSVS